MRAQEFAAKWRALAPNTSERAAYQEHFRDLCALLGQPTPSSDFTGQDYAFEKAVKKAGTGEQGYADVFKRGYFIFEYKGKGKSLGKALQQALLYARELDNPPLLLVSDLVNIEVHTNFTGSSPRRFDLTLDDIAQDRHIAGDLTALQVLRAAFTEPAKLDPRQLRERVTQDATAQIGTVAASLQAAGAGTSAEIAHFLMRVVFAMFSEDVGLLERGLLTRLLEAARRNPAQSEALFSGLFGAMKGGGYFGASEIRHFNGGLFDDDSSLPLTAAQVDALLGAARLDWAQVEPAIFGTLFEESLDAATRSRRGAHYTGVRDILRVVEPVMLQPLRREWAAVKLEAEALAGKKGGQRGALTRIEDFLKRLETVTVLDPACGSGNFLVVALTTLQDLEHEVRQVGFALGAGPFELPPRVHPRQMRGIEIEPFARELASVSVWIAYFQWIHAHTGKWPSPVLERLGAVEQRDALLNEDGTEAAWPEAEFIVGNPPFLGEKKQGEVLGREYVAQLRETYRGRVPARCDLVCYWFEKARAEIERGTTQRAGLISTNSINMPGNRSVLERINDTGAIFGTWPDLPWMQAGAAVRVAAVAFDGGQEQQRWIGRLLHERTEDETERVREVGAIHPTLTDGPDLSQAVRLPENLNLSFQGVKLAGAFDISGEQARAWLDLPNPGGVSNRDVLRPLLNGDDLTGERRDVWVIDFAQMSEAEAAQHLVPFAHVVQEVKPIRERNKRKSRREKYWQLAEVMPAMRRALAPLPRYLGTSIVAKHRTFVWCDGVDLPSGRLVVVASDQDWMHGVLNSRVHVWWANAHSSSHGKGNDLVYTSTSCFETFPFPEWTAETQEAVAAAARFVEQARADMRARGFLLTGMYNEVERAQSATDSGYTLKLGHDRLDQAVAAAYGWTWPLEEGEVLSRLLALNRERAAE